MNADLRNEEASPKLRRNNGALYVEGKKEVMRHSRDMLIIHKIVKDPLKLL